jgi:hypothetical protein
MGIEHNTFQQEALHFSLEYHRPTDKVQQEIGTFRTAAHEFSRAIFEALPAICRERSIAVTHLEDCVMWVVKGMVLEEARMASVGETDSGVQANPVS